MSLQTLLLALLPIAYVAWRLRRLVRVLRGGGSSATKIGVSAIIVLGLALRLSRWVHVPGAIAASTLVAPHHALAPHVDRARADSARARRTTEAQAMIATGVQALARCDTATANHSFERVAGIGIEMMQADSTAGDALFYQAVALAGLRDSTNAAVLAAEGTRLDRAKHVASDTAAHSWMFKHVSSLARKKC